MVDEIFSNHKIPMKKQLRHSESFDTLQIDPRRKSEILNLTNRRISKRGDNLAMFEISELNEEHETPSGFPRNYSRTLTNRVDRVRLNKLIVDDSSDINSRTSSTLHKINNSVKDETEIPKIINPFIQSGLITKNNFIFATRIQKQREQAQKQIEQPQPKSK